MKIDWKDALAVLIVFLLPLGIGQFEQKTTLPSYEAAIAAKNMMEGFGERQLHLSFVAFAASAHSHLASPVSYLHSIVAVLLALSPLILAFASAFFYTACRSLGYGKAESAFAVVLAAASPLAVLLFLPGEYGSLQAGFFPFSIFFLSAAKLARGKKERLALFLASAAIFGFLAGYINAGFAASGLALAAFYAASLRMEGEKERAYAFGILAALLAASWLASQESQGFGFSAGNIAFAFKSMPFLIAASSICIGLFFFGRGAERGFAMLLLSLALAGFFPLGAMALLTIPAADGFSRILTEQKMGAKLLSSFAFGFFIAFGIIFANQETYLAVGPSALIGLLLPVLVYFYEDKSRLVFSSVGAGLLVLSLSYAVFLQLPPYPFGYPKYTNPSLVDAMESVWEEGFYGPLAVLDREDAASFYLKKPQIGHEDIFSFLVLGKGSLPSGTTVIASIDGLSALGRRGGFEIYKYAGNYTSQWGKYAIFLSDQGRLISREIAENGKLALSDGLVLDRSGRYYSNMPISRMFMLYDSAPFSSQKNRLIVLTDEESLPPAFLDMASGKDKRIKGVKEYGDVLVYTVK